MNEADLIQSLTRVIQELKASLQEQYEFLIFEPAVRMGAAGPELYGQVLTDKQRQRLLAQIREVYPGPLIDQLVVLERVEAAGPWYQLIRQAGPLDVWSSPEFEKLATQILPGDPPFSILLETERGLLVKTADGSLGWIERAGLERCSPTGERPDFTTAPFSAPSELEEQLRAGVWQFGREALGAPYRLGGRDLRAGLDCSALTQLAYEKSSGKLLDRPILLPKHSLDQMKVGLRITQERAKTGDLIFLRHPVKNISHVALYGSPENGLVTHASREAEKVVTEPAEALLQRDRLLGFRTYFQKADPG